MYNEKKINDPMHRAGLHLFTKLQVGSSQCELLQFASSIHWQKNNKRKSGLRLQQSFVK
jgi:hypothetical protein